MPRIQNRKGINGDRHGIIEQQDKGSKWNTRTMWKS